MLSSTVSRPLSAVKMLQWKCTITHCQMKNTQIKWIWCESKLFNGEDAFWVKSESIPKSDIDNMLQADRTACISFELFLFDLYKRKRYFFSLICCKAFRQWLTSILNMHIAIVYIHKQNHVSFLFCLLFFRLDLKHLKGQKTAVCLQLWRGLSKVNKVNNSWWCHQYFLW